MIKNEDVHVHRVRFIAALRIFMYLREIVKSVGEDYNSVLFYFYESEFKLHYGHNNIHSLAIMYEG